MCYTSTISKTKIQKGITAMSKNNNAIQVRFPNGTKELIMQDARDAKLTVSAYIRQALLQKHDELKAHK